MGHRIITAFVLGMTLVSVPVVAAPSGGSSSGAGTFDSRETVGTILLSGLIGGILGLSTLSFYSRPQDHIKNITIGAGGGMIISAIYVTYALTQNPKSIGVLAPVTDGQSVGVAFSRNF